MAKLDILGFYYKIMEEDEFRTLQADPKSVDKLFNELARQKTVQLGGPGGGTIERNGHQVLCHGRQR